MAKIKLTKTQKKAEQDALRQYLRFLPTLQLKKQQLLVELRQSADRLREAREAFDRENERLAVFAGLFGDDALAAKAAARVRMIAVHRGEMNIAGIEVPTFDRVEFADIPGDLFVDDPAVEDCIEALKTVISNREAYAILEEQHRMLDRELTVTTQRVNLFEKVKIPEARENIRKITIYLSDQDTAAVVRSKIAKGKNTEAAA
jgi:V/A-type H+-transporting ATPase subunit D